MTDPFLEDHIHRTAKDVLDNAQGLELLVETGTDIDLIREELPVLADAHKSLTAIMQALSVPKLRVVK